LEMKLDFCNQAVASVNYLHGCHIIHRDIKSLNYLVFQDGQLKLGDFGFAKVKTVCSLVSSTRSKSDCIGTARWRAPETVGRGAKWTDKSDVFSLAMTLYEIVMQKIPFETERDNSIVPMLIRDGERPDFSSELESHPIVLDVIKPGWTTNPNDRPTAEELAKTIACLLGNLEAPFPKLIKDLPVNVTKIVVELMDLDLNNNWVDFASKIWPSFTHINQKIYEQKGKMMKVLEDWGIEGGTTFSLLKILKELERLDVLTELQTKFPSMRLST